MARFFRYLFGIPLAALGVSLAVATYQAIKYPYSPTVDVNFDAFFAALCLLGAFFLLRRA
jgi:hypothetical protein